jgi:hypothetical protein
VYANTDIILTTSYSTVSASYPSPYRNSEIRAAHSIGVNTFDGENSFVTIDNKSANVELYGANSIDFGNIYFGNVNFGTPGTFSVAIQVLGGTLESIKGHCKMEAKSIFMDVVTGQLYGWEMQLALGGGGSASLPLVLVHTDSLSTVLIEGFNLSVNYYDPSQSIFAGKSVFGTVGTPKLQPVISNVTTTINQTLAQYNAPPWPAWFVGVTHNARMNLVDTTYTLDGNIHTKTVPGTIYLGRGNSTVPVQIGTIHLPPILEGFNAQAMTVRLTGLVTSTNPEYSGGDTFITSVALDTVRGAFSPSSGAITVGSGTSDNILSATAAIAVSTNPGLALLAGANLTLTYNSGARTITVWAYPLVSGTTPGGIAVWLSNAKIEVSAAGRSQVLTYIGN